VLFSLNIGRPPHPVGMLQPIRNTPIPLPWFSSLGSALARTHEMYGKVYISFCIVTRGTSPLLRMGLFRSLVPSLPPAGAHRTGTHYRHYHEFPQLLRLCCTATKMAAGCILPCKEDALLVCSSFYCGACTVGMSCYVIPLDN